MELPTNEQMEAAFATVASAGDYGIPGTLRIGLRDAPERFVLNGRTYQGEDNILAPFAVLLSRPEIIKPGWQIALVLAQHERRMATASMNRLPVGYYDETVWEYDRATALQSVFHAYSHQYVMDLQENDQPASPEGWTMDISTSSEALERLSESIPAPQRFKRLADMQLLKTATSPLGNVYGGAVAEVLCHPRAAKGGVEAAVQTVIATLAGLGALQGNKNRKSGLQHVYRAVDVIRCNPALSYTLSHELLLQPFKIVRRGEVLATASNRDKILAPDMGYLALGPSKLEVPAGRTDPLFYFCKKEQPTSRVIALPEWWDE